MRPIYLIILLLTFSNITLLASNVATITGLRGKAFIFRAEEKKDAKLGEELLNKDKIKTTANSKMQIIFQDETVVTLGQNSDFSIEKYLYENKKEPLVEFSMLKGAMRTITGKIGKIAPQRFKVKTKTATIGIRGTNFSILLDDDGTFTAFCTYGAISVNVSNKEYIAKEGFMVHIAVDGQLDILKFSPEELKKMKTHYFSLNEKRATKIQKQLNNTQADALEPQLDITVDDKSEFTIEDTKESHAYNVLNASLAEKLAGYTMNDAFYTGTYQIFGDPMTSLPCHGSAELKIDFGANTATLVLDPGGTDATFNRNPIFKDVYFAVEQSNPNDSDYADSDSIQPIFTANRGYFENVNRFENDNRMDESSPYYGGYATGKFQKPTGNEVKGNFIYDEQGYQDSGTYNVTTSQNLH